MRLLPKANPLIPVPRPKITRPAIISGMFKDTIFITFAIIFIIWTASMVFLRPILLTITLPKIEPMAIPKMPVVDKSVLKRISSCLSQPFLAVKI